MRFVPATRHSGAALVDVIVQRFKLDPTIVSHSAILAGATEDADGDPLEETPL